MKASDLSKALAQEGFRPFRINMSNGESYRITHPDQVMVDRSVAVVGTSRVDGTRRYENLAICALNHVVSLVPLEESEVE